MPPNRSAACQIGGYAADTMANLPKIPPAWALAAVLAVLAVGVALALWPDALERQARRIQAEVADIRGKPFKTDVEFVRATPRQWQEFTDQELAKALKVDRYWDVMRMLGLYRGPDLDRPEKIFADAVRFAPGAYDAHQHRFLLMNELDEPGLSILFAHELYHGFQDQHFDVKTYLLEMALAPGTSSDEFEARRAVVEGEAAWIDAIYQARMAGIRLPTRQQTAELLGIKGEWQPAKWERLSSDSSLSEAARLQLRQFIETRKHLPAFMLETLMAAYFDGSVFIDAVRERGWSEVEKLYGEYPPRSTEQVLHPEKWFAREEPVGISWPDLQSDPLFTGWKLLDQNVLGERAWQIVFREQGMHAEASSAAAGWNGNRYAVFFNPGTHELLLLMYTSWDTQADAEEFSAAYRRLLEAKHRESPMPTRVAMHGNDVLIVEGASEASIDAFMEFNRRAAVSGS